MQTRHRTKTERERERELGLSRTVRPGSRARRTASSFRFSSLQLRRDAIIAMSPRHARDDVEWRAIGENEATEDVFHFRYSPFRSFCRSFRRLRIPRLFGKVYYSSRRAHYRCTDALPKFSIKAGPSSARVIREYRATRLSLTSHFSMLSRIMGSSWDGITGSVNQIRPRVLAMPLTPASSAVMYALAYRQKSLAGVLLFSFFPNKRTSESRLPVQRWNPD